MPPPGGYDEDEMPGLRRPNMRSMLDAEEMAGDETEGDGAMEEYVLLDGDIIMSKVTMFVETETGDAWVTYGTQTRVMPNETEGHAFDRLATIVTARAAQQALMVADTAGDIAQARREQQRSHRIPTGRTGG